MAGASPLKLAMEAVLSLLKVIRFDWEFPLNSLIGAELILQRFGYT